MSTNLPPDDPSPSPSGPGSEQPGPIQPSPQQPGPQQPGAEFFDRIRAIGLVRPDDGRWAAGVCAGIARRTGIDVVLVRGLFVVLAVFGGGALFLYGLGWLFMPHPDGRIHAQEVLRGVVTAGFVGSVVAVVVGLPFDTDFHAGPPFWGWGFRPGGLILLIGLAIVVWAVMSRRGHGSGGPGGTPSGTTGRTSGSPQGPGNPPPGTPESGGTPSWGSPENPPRGTGSDETTSMHRATSAPAPTAVPVRPQAAPAVDLTRPSHGLTRAVLGLAVLTAASVALYDRFAGDVPAVVAVATASALGVIALGIMAAGVLGRRSGGLAPIAWLVAIVAVNAATLSNLHLDRHDVTWRPTNASVARSGLDEGAGDVLVDLTDPALRVGATAADPVEVVADLGVGRMVVEVPGGTATRIEANVGLGEIDDQADGSGTTGGSQSRTVTVGSGTTTLVVRAHVGLGQIVIIREGMSVAAGGSARPLALTSASEALR